MSAARLSPISEGLAADQPRRRAVNNLKRLGVWYRKKIPHDEWRNSKDHPCKHAFLFTFTYYYNYLAIYGDLEAASVDNVA